MTARIQRELHELNVLFRSIPAPAVTLFAVSMVIMNLLANKSIDLPMDWLALDGGILVSWIAFLSMDLITSYFGPKAATEVSIFAVLVNLAVCLFFFLAGALPGMWGEAYVDGSEALLNGALDRTISGTWYVLLGSTVAFLVSAFVNNFLNYAIGKALRREKGGFGTYAVRSYVSTALGQFCDNLVFALIVSHVFFGWSLLQCVMCSFTGMVVELLCEILFSPLGYALCQKWKRDNVGREYFRLRETEGKESLP